MKRVAWRIDSAGHSDYANAVSDFQFTPRFVAHAGILRAAKEGREGDLRCDFRSFEHPHQRQCFP
jgi:hypothetical protein